jgi:hypothetical protein
MKISRLLTKTGETGTKKISVTQNFKSSENIFLKYGEWCRDQWYTPVIPVLGSLRQEDFEFKVSLDFETLSQKKKKKKAGPSDSYL